MWITMMNILVGFGLIVLFLCSCYMFYAFREQKKRLQKIHQLAEQSDLKEFNE